jgi:haloalkane dehalogenase
VGFDAYQQHLGAFFDEVAPSAFHLLVHDFGGVLGLAWAAEHPQRVQSLTVLSTTVRRSPRVTALIVANLLGGHRLLRRVLPYSMVRKRAIDPELLDHWAAPWRFRRLLRGADHFAERHLEPLRWRLSRITCPVLVVWGDRDPVFPKSHGEQIAGLVKQSRLEILPNCGHWSPLDAPEELGALVREQCLTSK